MISGARLHVSFFTVLLCIFYRELFGRLYDFNGLQLSFVLFLQAITVFIPFYRGVELSTSNTLQTIGLCGPLLVIPMMRIHLENTNKSLLRRVTFVKFRITNEAAEETKKEIIETTKHLNDIRNKLRLTPEQLRIVEANSKSLDTEGLLSGYMVDLIDELEFQGKIGNGAFGKSNPNPINHSPPTNL